MDNLKTTHLKAHESAMAKAAQSLNGRPCGNSTMAEGEHRNTTYSTKYTPLPVSFHYCRLKALGAKKQQMIKTSEHRVMDNQQQVLPHWALPKQSLTYLYSLYLEAKALPQCSCGQQYGLCSGFALSLSTLGKEAADSSYWHFPWLSLSRPLGLGTSCQPVVSSSSSCFAS